MKQKIGPVVAVLVAAALALVGGYFGMDFKAAVCGGSAPAPAQAE